MSARRMAKMLVSSAASLIRINAPANATQAARAALPAFARPAITASRLGRAAAPVSLAASGLFASNVTSQRFYSVTTAAVEGAEDSATEEGAAPSEDAAPAGPTPVRLYVGNLAWGVDTEMLGEVFAEYSIVEHTVVFDQMSNRSRGFGFVTVPNQEIADQAIAALNGMELEGRDMKVNISQTPDKRPERGPRTPRFERNNYQNDGRKVYLGNLSWGMDHLDLQDLCSEFGQVQDARLITDRETGRSRGFGFVTMSSTSEADEVVAQLNGQDVDGRILRVNIAKES